MELRKILCPTEFADLSQRALEYAADLAHDYGARLIILHAVETLGAENVTYGEAVSRPQPDSYRQRLWNDLHQVRVPDPDVAVEYVLSEGDPVEAILRTAAEQDCDLIVMGSHGRHGLRRLLEGSVAERVVRDAPCPVLVVKAPVEREQLPQKQENWLHPQPLTEKGP